jgi:uncharacterized protein YkwD
VCLAAALVAAAHPAAAAAAPVRSVQALQGSFATSILSRINAARRAHGLKPLRVASALVRAASAHALSMARHGFFSHDSLDGTPPMARIRRYLPAASVGETLLWRSPGCTPAQAVSMWLNSPEHRAILLSRAYRRLGLAGVHARNAPGVYGGRQVRIVAADFAS